MSKKLLIRDLTLRDGQQSLFATRMNQDQVERVLPYFKDAGFYAMEVWGGAVPDSVMRYLDENPWNRLETIKAAIGDVSKLTALSRGRNLFGYNPYPESVIKGFNKNAIESGIGIMRIFDALNDVDNMKSTIEYVKENGGMADCAVCYTVDPRFKLKDRFIALKNRKKLPKNIFSIEYFVDIAKKLEDLGADIISIKDMAGLIPPAKAGRMIKRLKQDLRIPIDFHTHCTPGFGLGAVLSAMINGVDIVDTNIMTFAGGPAAPAYEIIHIFADKLGIDTGVNKEAVVKIDKELRKIRHELAEFDLYKMFPRDFNFITDKLPIEIEKHFDDAIKFAKAEKDDELLVCIHAIEKYFNFPEPDENVKNAEIPGGMYTNMFAQLKQLKLDHLLNKVLSVIPKVRLDAGCPPLVTPTSQIVGVQAVNCIIDENNGDAFYTNNSVQFVNLVKGQYGKTPWPVDPSFREKIAGSPEETPYDTSGYEKQDNPMFLEYGGLRLADNEKDELLLELFPSVAGNYLKKKIEEKYITEIKSVEDEENIEYRKEKEKFAKLPQDEKDQLLDDGLNKF